MSWRAGLTRPMINQRATQQRRINPAYGRYTVIAHRISPDVHVRAVWRGVQPE
jgi:hypothetical protein